MQGGFRRLRDERNSAAVWRREKEKISSVNALIVICAKYLFVVAPLLFAFVFAAQPQARRALLIRGVIALLLAVVLAKGGGALYEEPRPFAVRHVAPLIPHEPDNGFPSDHTLVCAVCAFLILPLSRPVALAAGVVTLTVGAARIAALIHSPLDILASIAFAVFACVAAYGIERRFFAKSEAF